MTGSELAAKVGEGLDTFEATVAVLLRPSGLIRRFVVRPLAAAFVVGVAIVAVVLLGSASGIIGEILPEHCVVGLTGAAVSIQVDGAGASAQCDSYAIQVTDGGSWYRYQGDLAPGGAVICQVPWNGRTYTVRDQGLGNLYGTSVCQQLIGAAGP